MVGEYGIVPPVGIEQLRHALPDWLEEAANGLMDNFHILMRGLAEDLRYLDNRIKALDEHTTESVNKDSVTRRLMIRTACPVRRTWRRKDLQQTAYLCSLAGAEPLKQHSTDTRDRLLCISKRYDSYLRKLLVHGEPRACYAMLEANMTKGL